MKILVIAAMALLVSCGKKVEKTVYVENPFDNSQNEERLAEIERRINDLEQSHSSLVERLETSEDNAALLQSAVNEITLDLVTLSGKLESLEVFDAMIDPCGDGPGFDEVLIKTSKGRIIVYFEEGGRRFLTVLPAGNYRTTDRQACSFSVDASGNVR